MSLNYVTLSGQFTDAQDNPLSGLVTITPNVTVYASGIPVLEADVPIQAQVVGGQLRSASGGTLQLLATDNSGLSFAGQTGFLFYTVVITLAGQVLDPWSFFLPHSTLGNGPVDLYSLANTAAGGSSAVASVFGRTGAVTAQSGDYTAAQVGADASGAAAAAQAAAEAASVPLSDLPLAIGHGGSGQTTQQAAIDALAGAQTAAEFLRGNGTHVQMSAIQAGDVPQLADYAPTGLTGATAASRYAGATASGAPTSGTFALGDWVYDQAFNLIRVCVTAGSPGIWLRAGQQPWQFYVEDYGAKGNGKVIGDAIISGGSLSTLTSASAAFTGADTGKYIMVNGADGNNSAPLITTITYVSATTVTLGTAASSAVTNASAIYGTDDLAAINSCVAAAHSYAIANGFFAQIIFRAVNYCLASGPTQSGNGSSTPTFNSQIPLPYPNTTGAGQKEILEFAGAGTAGEPNYWESAVPDLQGTCLVSMVLAPNSGGTSPYGAQSVIGGPSQPKVGFTGGFPNIKPVLVAMRVVCPWGAQQIGVDFRGVSAFQVRNGFSAFAFSSVNGNYSDMGSLVQSGLGWNGGGLGANSIGFYAPTAGNNDDCYADSICVEGFAYSAGISEHFTCGRLCTIYAAYCLFAGTAGGYIHGASILNWSAEASMNVIQTNGGQAGGFPLFVGLLDTEVISGSTWNDGNALSGQVTWSAIDQSAPVISGGNAQKLKFINARQVPGPWSGAPAVPATTVAQQNTAWRDATIYLTSGGAAVTVIAVDGTTTGLTLGSSGTVAIRVPAGHSFTLTYASTAPTAAWVLD